MTVIRHAYAASEGITTGGTGNIVTDATAAVVEATAAQWGNVHKTLNEAGITAVTNSFYYAILDPANATAAKRYEFGIGTYVSDAAGATTFSRSIIESSNSDNAIDADTTAIVVMLGAVPRQLDDLERPSSQGIVGCNLVYDGAQTYDVKVETGKFKLNGVWYEITSDINGGSFIENDDTAPPATLDASSLYYVYLTVEAGTVKVMLEKRAAASDDPVNDEDLGYWKHPDASGHTGGLSTTDEDYRCIGYINTDALSTTIQFSSCVFGNMRLVGGTDRQVIFDNNTGTATEASMTALLPKMSVGITISAALLAASGTEEVRIGGSSTLFPRYVDNFGTGANWGMSGLFVGHPGNDSLWHQTAGSPTTARGYLYGCLHQR